MRCVLWACQNHLPGCLTYNHNIVLCADNPAPGRTLTSLARYAAGLSFVRQIEQGSV